MGTGISRLRRRVIPEQLNNQQNWINNNDAIYPSTFDLDTGSLIHGGNDMLRPAEASVNPIDVKPFKKGDAIGWRKINSNKEHFPKARKVGPGERLLLNHNKNRRNAITPDTSTVFAIGETI